MHRDPFLELRFPTPLRVVLCVCNKISPDGIIMASYVKVASCCGSIRNTIMFFSWTAKKLNVLECVQKAATMIQNIPLLALVIYFSFQTLFKIASLLSFSPCVEIQFWGYSFRHRCAVASFCGCIGNIIFFCSWISCIVFEWLDEGCDIDFLPYFFHFAASDFKFFGKMLQNGFFLLSRQDPFLEPRFSSPLRVVLLCFAIQSLLIPLS